MKPILTIVLAAALAGCHCATADKALVQTMGGSDPQVQIDFWHELDAQPVTSNDDAFHALLLYFDNKDDGGDYAARVTTLKQRGWLPDGFSAPPLAAVERGTVAVILVRALNITGGVTITVLGPIPRYAVRALQARNVYPPSSPGQTFSGHEFLAIIGRVEDYQRTAGVGASDAPAAPPPPPAPLKQGATP